MFINLHSVHVAILKPQIEAKQQFHLNRWMLFFCHILPQTQPHIPFVNIELFTWKEVITSLPSNICDDGFFLKLCRRAYITFYGRIKYVCVTYTPLMSLTFFTINPMLFPHRRPTLDNEVSIFSYFQMASQFELDQLTNDIWTFVHNAC